MATSPPPCDFGWQAVDFNLPATDGRHLSLADVAGPKGLVIAFICNHCPYVIAVLDRIRDEAEALRAIGVGFVAISSNDVEAYPQDGFDEMKALAKRAGFGFPYLYDETQEIARAYSAACTPDFFGFNTEGRLQYRGRLDTAGRQPAGPDTRRELFEAMKLVAETGHGPKEQTASMGCSIKWKPE